MHTNIVFFAYIFNRYNYLHVYNVFMCCKNFFYYNNYNYIFKNQLSRECELARACVNTVPIKAGQRIDPNQLILLQAKDV